MRRAWAEIRKVKAYFIANLLLGLFFILLLTSFDVGILAGHISELFGMRVELFMATVFLAVQALLVARMLFVQYRKERKSLTDLLRQDENEAFELKSSLRWDYELERVNKDLEYAVIKTIAGLLNTRGGTLLIGVSDDKRVLGLERDWCTLKRRDGDGFTQHLARLIGNELGNTSLADVSIGILPYGQVQVCRVDVWPSEDPVFVTKGQREEFYIRIANMTVSLPAKQAFMFIEKRRRGR